MREIEKKIEDLRQKIRHHDYMYYVLSQPEISDKEYDDLMRKLKSLEEAHPEFISLDSPTQRVGGSVSEGFKTVKHKVGMLSLDNAYTYAELEDWGKRLRKGLGREKEIEYVVELKMDGVSLNLTYEKGSLRIGATRGDGAVGEDVTNNIKTIRAIPLKLMSENVAELIEIRGEVYLDKEELENINKQREKEGEVLFANPRNAASGSLKLLDPAIVAKRHLKFFAHSLGALKGQEIKSQWDFLEVIKTWGLPVNSNNKLCKTLDEVIAFCESFEGKREKCSYEIDGIVVKVNSLEQQRILGFTLKSPRWAVAYKFPAHQATTQVLKINVQVGRTGVITPVAELKPVECAGVVIKHSTLHNFDEIKRLGLKVGDRVLIERAGEVIPKIIKVIETVRKGKESYFQIPKACPACGSKIEKEKKEDVAYRCINPSCPAQLERGLVHFASRQAMDIEGMGESVVEQLVRKKMVSDFADIYFLKKDDLLKLDLFKDKKAENLLVAISRSKKQPLARLVYALGIRHVGEKAAFVLAKEFKTLDRIMASKKDDFDGIYEIGTVMAQSIEDFFKQENTKRLIKRLRDSALNIKEEEARQEKTILTDKTIVFTGELRSLARSQAEQAVRSMGGLPSLSVSKKTDFVVAGEKPGSKFDKAKALGLRIINEKEFLHLIGKG